MGLLASMLRPTAARHLLTSSYTYASKLNKVTNTLARRRLPFYNRFNSSTSSPTDTRRRQYHNHSHNRTNQPEQLTLTRPDAQKQTIYALATPPGKGGVAVIRVSGPEALEVWRRMVRPYYNNNSKKKNVQSIPTAWKLERCKIVHPENPDEVIDDGLCVFFQAPKSFTTEPTLELHTHSGRALITTLLKALSTLPFLRHAEPGEFTKRAFLNGRLDLTEVEGLADLIDAETEEQRRIAGRGAWGEIRKVYDDIRRRVIHCLAQVEALIDFGEGEDLEEGVYEQAREEAKFLLAQIQSYLSDNRRGEILRSGVKLAIFGPPNAGKSSLLNYLAQREAAIVTNIPGTTRDVVQLTLDIGGMPVVVADTAGLRETEDMIEGIGIEKGIEAVKEADVRLCVLSLDDVDIDENDNVPSFKISTPDAVRELINIPNTYILFNKMDLLPEGVSTQSGQLQLPNLQREENLPDATKSRSWVVSISKNQGTTQFLEGFGEELRKLYSYGTSTGDQSTQNQAPIITRARHRVHLENACLFLKAFLDCPPEDIVLAAEELRYATRELGRVTGVIDVEDILDAVFRDFCIGK